MNCQDPLAADLGVASVAEPKAATRPVANAAESAGDWLCAWCLNRVANECDRFQFNGQDEFIFTNPEGMVFAIITFREIHGCRQTGSPTLDHTWFPGHAWCYCHCGQCGRHLGWYYAGEHAFAGLIRDRIVRAVCLRN